MKPDISVIVPVYNGEEVIDGCLEALLKQELPQEAYEVIVVDNGSTDMTVEKVRRYPVRLLEEPLRSSYAARNTGVRAARGSVFAFTDADCRPYPQWLPAALQAIGNGAECVGGRIEHQVSDLDSPWERYTTLFFFDQRTYVANGWAATANLITTRAFFDQVGLFRIAESGSDIVWGLRASAKGARWCYSDKATVRHLTRKGFWAIASTLCRNAMAIGRIERQRSPYRSFVAYKTLSRRPDPRPFLRLCRTCVEETHSLRSSAVLLAAWPVLEVIRVWSFYQGWRRGRRQESAPEAVQELCEAQRNEAQSVLAKVV